MTPTLFDYQAVKVHTDQLVLRCEWCGEEVALDEAGSMLADPRRFVDKHRKCLLDSEHAKPTPPEPRPAKR